MNVKEVTTTSAPQLVLVLGGARSGKSTFAERLAIASQRQVAFIATATASDNEMRDRIQCHRLARPTTWHTFEEPLQLAQAIKQAALVADVLLLDCMTIWLTNWLLAQGDGAIEDDAPLAARYRIAVSAAIDEVLQTWSTCDTQKTLVIVSNEVGLGIVPAYPLGRAYRDLLGLVNQRLAAAANRVYLMVAGLAVDIKRLHEEASL
jgi:adenosylcobinamide kinase/adenosylcobinamide-phosphate guanylyltransferase